MVLKVEFPPSLCALVNGSAAYGLHIFRSKYASCKILDYTTLFIMSATEFNMCATAELDSQTSKLQVIRLLSTAVQDSYIFE